MLNPGMFISRIKELKTIHLSLVKELPVYFVYQLHPLRKGNLQKYDRNKKLVLRLRSSPEWTCIIVGFTTGYVRMYTEVNDE
jgi:hypothetical protein